MNGNMVDILAIGAHPDDVEFACGAILAKMADQGKSIVIADMTLGQKGSHGTSDLRLREGEAAAAVIGAKRVYLNFIDCEVMDSYDGRLELVRLIREQRPRLVIAPMWKGEQNHPDHLATGAMVRYACRYARFKNVLPDLPIHWVDGILHYPPPTIDAVDFLIDVTPYVDTWMKMIRCHASQLETFPYDEWNKRLASKFGILMNVDYAQGLVKGNPIVVDDLMQVSKGTREL
jgi:N-acetylglucosamine malate deacetylase 1